MENIPKFYKNLRERFAEYGNVLEELGRISKDNGPIDTKTAHLLKLVAAAAIRSEGAVHSHTRRALKAGAGEDEIYHALIITTSTIGFPTVAAAISWVDDIVYGKKEGKILNDEDILIDIITIVKYRKILLSILNSTY